MSELGRAFAQLRTGTNADQILDRLAQHAGQVSSADRACVLLRAEPSRGWAIMGHSWPEAPRSLDRVSVEEGKPLERVVSKRESVWVKAPSRELSEFDRLLGVELGFLGLAPVVTEGVVLGVLVLGWIGRERPSEILRAQMEALCEHAGSLLELAVLKSELEVGGLRAELSARAEGAEALHRVAAEMAGRRDPSGIAEEAVQALLHLYGADAGAFYMVDPDGGRRQLVKAGLPGARTARLASTEAEGLQQFFEGGIKVVTSVSRDIPAPARDLLLEQGMTCVVTVPAVSGQRTVGALILYHREPRAYRPHELALLESFAVQLAGGLRIIEAHAALEAAAKQREEFLTLIAHELRHPVAAIATLAETLADTPGLGTRERKALDGLRGQARALSRLAEEVLQLAGLESGLTALTRRRFDLSAMVANMVRQNASASRIVIESPAQVMVDADPILIGHAIENVIGNALKYSSDAEAVKVRIAPSPQDIRVEVTDQGVGMEATELGRLFTRYGRIVNSRTAGVTGVGLGLYLTRLLVEAHGGTITAQSPGPRQGSSFTITLPNGEASPRPHR